MQPGRGLAEFSPQRIELIKLTQRCSFSALSDAPHILRGKEKDKLPQRKLLPLLFSAVKEPKLSLRKLLCLLFSAVKKVEIISAKTLAAPILCGKDYGALQMHLRHINKNYNSKNNVKLLLLFQKLLSIFRKVFIGYGLKTGQGFYPGPIFFTQVYTFSATLFALLRQYNFIKPIPQICEMFQ